VSDEHPTIGDMTYELLKKMRAEQQEMRLELLDLELRATSVDEHLGGIMMATTGSTGLRSGLVGLSGAWNCRKLNNAH
jgi:hypothetical protein